MNDLGSIRARLVTTVAGALGNIPVYFAWPTNVSAPCAVVLMGAGAQRKQNHWETQWHVTVLGPSGDNEASTTAVEDMTSRLAAAISEGFTARVTWSRPVSHVAVGSPYFSAELTVSLDMEPAPITRRG